MRPDPVRVALAAWILDKAPATPDLIEPEPYLIWLAKIWQRAQANLKTQVPGSTR